MTELTLTCRVCGGEFDLPHELNRRACPFCGTEASRPRVKGDPLASLRRAHHQRASCDFVNATASYQSVLRVQPDEAEALWGLVLCKYGVEYVEDEKTHVRRPVVHFLRGKPITEDSDFLLACQNAPEEDRQRYAADAQYIQRIQQGVNAASAAQKPWDVFLCYKASIPGSGDVRATTAEYAHAQELYFRLSMEGYRVFFAHETLSNAAGADYEAQIFYALQSARVMLVVCSNPDYLMTPWVHSEWSRYLSRMDEHTADCRLVPLLYDGCNPYALPDAFRNRSLQGLRMSELTALDNLRQVLSAHLRPQSAAPAASASHSLLLRITQLLEDGDWEWAEKRARELIDQQPDCSEAHLSLLLARYHLPQAEALRTCTASFEDDLAWKRALTYAAPAEKERLNNFAQDARLAAGEDNLAQLLRSGDWKKALALAETLHARHPKHPGVCRSLLLAELELPALDELADCLVPFENRQSWKLLLRISPEADQKALNDLLERSLHERELARLEEDARLLIQDGKWNPAEYVVHTLARSESRRSDHYLVQLLFALRLRSEAQLTECPTAFEELPLWQKTMELASPDKRAQLAGIVKQHAAFMEVEQKKNAAYQPHADAAKKRQQEYMAEETRIRQLLSARQWAQAAAAAQALRQNTSRIGEACLLELLATLQLPSVQALKTCPTRYESLPLWEAVLESVQPDKEELLLQISRSHQEYLRTHAGEPQRSPEGFHGAADRKMLQECMAEETRIRQLLSDGQWQQATTAAQALQSYTPRPGEAYLLELLASLKISTLAGLKNFPMPYENMSLWQKILQNIQPSRRTQLEEIAACHTAFLQSRTEPTPYELAQRERLAYIQAEQERLAREQAERMSHQPPAAGSPSHAIVVFARKKEHFFSAPRLTVYTSASRAAAGTIDAGGELTVHCPYGSSISVYADHGAPVWIYSPPAGTISYIDVHWPMMGNLKFTVRSNNPL